MKDRMKSYSFWVGLSGAIVAFVSAIGKAVGFIPNEELISSIILGFAGVLVALGVVSKPKSAREEKTEETLAEENAESETKAEEETGEGQSEETKIN